MEEEKKKTFFVCIFDISPYFFTQISIGRAHWMGNWIMHPTRTHSAYFWWAPLPQKQEIPKKMWWCGIEFRIQWVPTRHTFDGPLPQKQKIPRKTWWWCHHHIFKVFNVCWEAGSVKSIHCGYSLDPKFNSASKKLSRSKFV